MRHCRITDLYCTQVRWRASLKIPGMHSTLLYLTEGKQSIKHRRGRKAVVVSHIGAGIMKGKKPKRGR